MYEHEHALASLMCSLGLGRDLGNSLDREKERMHARSNTSRRASEKKGDGLYLTTPGFFHDHYCKASCKNIEYVHRHLKGLMLTSD